VSCTSQVLARPYLIRRVWEHKSKLIESFTEKYDVVRLAYFEQFDNPENAIKREKRLKKWNRAWKIRLIEENNPNWEDLYPGIAGSRPVVMPR
jgi:putative endonuclease